jgi:predicted TPR repeat methyltransferase
MNSESILKLSNELSRNYDSYVQSHSWPGPEILFEMISEYIKTGETLLDLGIGTGLSSKPFYNAGLKIFGIEGASGMIEGCKRKKMTEEIVQFDLTSTSDFPFSGKTFDHVISYAVFHFIQDLDRLFFEVSGHINPLGIFAFSVMPYSVSQGESVVTNKKKVYANKNKVSDFITYSHTDQYIQNLLVSNNLLLRKENSVLAFIDGTENREVYFKLYVTQKLID